MQLINFISSNWQKTNQSRPNPRSSLLESLDKPFFSKAWQVFTIFLFLLSLTILNQSFLISAQVSSSNQIDLNFPVVTQAGQDVATTSNGVDSWLFDGELGAGDEIRYGWKNANLNTRFESNPAVGGGYLEVYLNEDAEENFLFNYGASPLPVARLQDYLATGQNTLVFRYIDSNNQVGARVSFTFNYLIDPSDPAIEVVRPNSGIVLNSELDYNFRINLANFSLESINSNDSKKGQLRVYINSINDSNLLQTFTFSTKVDDNSSQVNFSSNDLNLRNQNIPDSFDSKLIFVLTRTSGELLAFRKEFPVITNFQNSLDVGLPRVVILDPDKSRTNLEVDGKRKFTLQIDNFKILESFSPDNTNKNEGYLQILIDDVPISTLHPKNEFALYDLEVLDLTPGRHTITVQLVRPDFQKLEPEAKDTIDIVYIQRETSDEDLNIQNINWRVYLIVGVALVVLVFVAWFILRS